MIVIPDTSTKAEFFAKFKAAAQGAPAVNKAALVEEVSRRIVAAVVAELPTSAPAGAPASPRHAADHVGAHLDAFSGEARDVHRAAIAFIEKAASAGKTVTYRDAIIETTRRTS